MDDFVIVSKTIIREPHFSSSLDMNCAYVHTSDRSLLDYVVIDKKYYKVKKIDNFEKDTIAIYDTNFKTNIEKVFSFNSNKEEERKGISKVKIDVIKSKYKIISKDKFLTKIKDYMENLLLYDGQIIYFKNYTVNITTSGHKGFINDDTTIKLMSDKYKIISKVKTITSPFVFIKLDHKYKDSIQVWRKLLDVYFAENIKTFYIGKKYNIKIKEQKLQATIIDISDPQSKK
ncbi:MAG: hypothetical protein Edafosvirus15_7 [Edafosvirus sp.]|uniref:Uncharacterized protein n=1 Tax=Edafosvirus sp. TaxID=2487765 RepID=A0A3G4ZU99_9VIRU|nr:MAG: hypothetical protein Edafosvirus15_7 [Edafosvirus sp.]